MVNKSGCTGQEMFRAPFLELQSLHADGTRQAVYVYTQTQLKPQNFIPIVAAFAQGATSEQTTVTLDFDARTILTHYTASQGQMTIGTGWSSGSRQ